MNLIKQWDLVSNAVGLGNISDMLGKEPNVNKSFIEAVKKCEGNCEQVPDCDSDCNNTKDCPHEEVKE